ncbi:MAG TPA: oligosaccharide flippase family protein [Candidatus Gastranaerophilaceae bacterium]|nr:oligosaccharide flippase family protein [Candidatus Gastranaerophilaceae bacterium]HPT40751.1 oligosaccharide flippase family protein [Candidatus Gastranaerophilaceae bacterium]
MEKALSKNHLIILDTFFKYLPSRFFIILNSLIIIPFLAHVISAREMGIFQLCIGILNLVCTCSTDWIAKSALRFWHKYKRKKMTDKFLSNVVFLTFLSYILIFVLYFCLSGFIIQKFSIDRISLLLTLFLVIPCGIRQFLYQMLRILNKPFMYTFSIIFYQLSLLVLFLFFSNLYSDIYALLIAMTVSIFVIDVYIIKQIGLEERLNIKPDILILKESLKYSLPLIGTNVSIWAVLNINKFIFQYNNMFFETAVTGICWFFTTNILAPIFSTLLFSVFPTIIKQFEKKRLINEFVTSTLQLYFVIFIPFVGIFCFFSKEIAKFILSEKYFAGHILLPFFAVSIFAHEFLKLMNIKYHLRNKTYIEMGLSIFVGIVAVLLNIFLLPKFNLAAAGFIMIFCVFLLIVLNSLINFKSLDYIESSKILKTGILATILMPVCFLISNFIFEKLIHEPLFIIAKVIISCTLYYILMWQFKSKILDQS